MYSLDRDYTMQKYFSHYISDTFAGPHVPVRPRYLTGAVAHGGGIAKTPFIIKC